MTPYTHVLITHIQEFVDLYGNIAAFNQQGLEKLSNEVTQHYFQSTNHRNIESLKQLLLKHNQLEEMAHNDCCHNIARIASNQVTILKHEHI